MRWVESIVEIVCYELSMSRTTAPHTTNFAKRSTKSDVLHGSGNLKNEIHGKPQLCSCVPSVYSTVQ